MKKKMFMLLEKDPRDERCVEQYVNLEQFDQQAKMMIRGVHGYYDGFRVVGTFHSVDAAKEARDARKSSYARKKHKIESYMI